MITASFWLSVVLKCSVLLAGAALLTGILRRRSAALLHRIWALSFAGCLLLPPLATLAPQLWSIPGLQLAAERSRPVSANHTAGPKKHKLSPPAGTTLSTVSAGPSRPVDHHAHRSEVTPNNDAAAAVDSGQPRPSAARPNRWTWDRVLLAVWLAGATLCSLLLFRQHLALRRLLFRTRPVDSAWESTWARVCQTFNAARQPRLRAVADLPTPAVTGMWQPTILVPEDSSGWSDAQRELVLIHELAHVQRHDLPIQMLPRLCCILLWFHPLAWYGAWQMRRLRELACDDLVLHVQQTPSDYADLLLNTARAWQRNAETEYVMGMVHGPEIRQRILAVLDQTRSRIPVNRRIMTLLLSTLTAIVVGFSTWQLQPPGTVAGEPLPATAGNAVTEDGSTQAHTPGDQDKYLRPMQITVLEEDNTPLANARVHAGVWDVRGFTGKRYGSRDFHTDEHGQVTIPIPRRLRILRLWATRNKYVPEFVNFALGTHREGRDIPEQFTFRLAKGTQLSGRVVNQQGAPIEGVNVAVSVKVQEPVWTSSPEPMISMWLTDSDWFDSQPVTDKDGRWTLTNAPAAAGRTDYRFSLKLSHPNYISDDHWGTLQSQQDITTAMLRDGTAQIVMSPGVSVTGRVTDASGQAVTAGLVCWNRNPYGDSTIYECEIDATGRYTTLPLSPGSYPFTIIAPGHSPELQQITVRRGMDDQDYQLSPGQRLQIAVVDQNDQPIPNAFVAVRGWRDHQALHNYKHDSVPDTQIPRHTDQHGIWTWNWAPQDRVQFRISAEGYDTQKCSLQADSSPHVIRLTRQLEISGTAVDAETGEPVLEFQVAPVRQYDNGQLVTLHKNRINATRGRFALRPGDSHWTGERFRVRIDAEGYRSWISSEAVTPGDANPIHAHLMPSPPRTGRITRPNGTPVAGADIVYSTDSAEVNFYENRPVGNPPGTRSDVNGQFRLADSFEPIRIRILHDQGFAETVVAPGTPIPKLILQPWASVRGQVLQDGQPLSGETVFLGAVQGPYGITPHISEDLQTLTDDDGRYEFPRVPRVPMRLTTLQLLKSATAHISHSIPLNLTNGPDHREVNPGQGRGGVITTASVLNQPAADAEGIYSRVLLLPRQVSSEFRNDHETAPPEAEPAIDDNWADNFDQIQARREPRESFYCSLPPNGQLQFDSVPTGTWDLLILYGEADSGRPVRSVRRTFVIGDGELQSGRVDLGELTMATH